MILGLGGSITWIEGWLFSLWFVAMILSTVIYMYVKDPDLLAERRKTSFFIFMTTRENTYLSTRVRIQSERKQQVISTGVYGFVRHPLYLGYLLLVIGGPLLLGSIVGLALAFLGIVAIMARIIGEEKMLLDELEGYEEYRKKVKYRILPFIW